MGASKKIKYPPCLFFHLESQFEIRLSSLFEFVRENPGGAMPASCCRTCLLLALALPSVASIYTSQYASQTATWGSGSVGYGVVRRIPPSGGALSAIRGGADTAEKAKVRDLAMNTSARITSV